MFKKIAALLEMIKFKLTIFAMPFAFTGAFLAARGVPEFKVFFLVVLAMVGARTSAMGFNRIVDWQFDGANPRTSNRAIPSGAVKLKEAWLMVILAAVLFFAACAGLNLLALMIAPFALALTFFYSYTKRFTSLCHVVLGVALAFSPLGGWVAVTGSFAHFPYALSLGVLFWVAGFDTIYACLDAEFDKKEGLYSLPAVLGSEQAFFLARIFHVIAFVFFLMTGIQAHLNTFFYFGIFLAGCALWYQHHLVNPRDLSRIQMSFFSMNGFISLAIFLATWIALITTN